MLKGIRRALVTYYTCRDPMERRKRRRQAPLPFGLGVSSASMEDGTISIIFTFRSGERYCCSSPACHFFNLFFSTNWGYFRELLAEGGVEVRSPLRFLIRVVYERGALFLEDPGKRDSAYTPWEQTGWDEFVTEESNPTDSQSPVRSSDSDGDGFRAYAPS